VTPVVGMRFPPKRRKQTHTKFTSWTEKNCHVMVLWLFAGLSPQRPWFNPTPNQVEFVTEEVVLA